MLVMALALIATSVLMLIIYAEVNETDEKS